MLRLIGALLLFSASLGIGLLKARALWARERAFRSFEAALIALEGEICALRPLPLALESAGAADKSGIMPAAAKFMRALDAKDGWRRAVENSKAAYFTKDDKEVLLSFGQGLGATDKDGQLKNIKLFRERVSRAAAAAGESYARLGRLYTAAGGLCGAAAVIMLM